MTVTALQTDIVWNDIPHNLATAEQLIKDSAGADLYVLPEMFSTGFIIQPDGNAEPEGGTTQQWMLRMAKETQAAITGSVAVQTSQGDYRNRMYFVKPDGTFAYYDKHHLFTYAGEHQHYTAGTEPVIVLWRGVRIMLQVCYDLRFPCFSRNNSKPSTLNSKPDRRVLIGDFSTRLFEHLKLSDKGFTPYHDKSPAEDIYATFGVSKKVFKQAVGDLLKRELIQIRPDGIELTIKGKATGVEE